MADYTRADNTNVVIIAECLLRIQKLLAHESKRKRVFSAMRDGWGIK